jgi:hypothetical protein
MLKFVLIFADNSKELPKIELSKLNQNEYACFQWSY